MCSLCVRNQVPEPPVSSVRNSGHHIFDVNEKEIHYIIFSGWYRNGTLCNYCLS